MELKEMLASNVPFFFLCFYSKKRDIQLGENWWGPHDMARSIAAHASDHVMLDVMKIGGVSGWLRAAALAEAAGLPVSSHIFPEFSFHLLGEEIPMTNLVTYTRSGPISRIVMDDGKVNVMSIDRKDVCLKK